MDQPLISVIIPCYNYGHLLDRAVRSVCLQDGCTYEVIIINDGSTDNSAAVIDLLKQEYPQVVSIHQDNAGLAAVRNRGVKESKGVFLVFLDADDEMDADALRVVADRIKTSPDAKVILGGHTSIEQNGKSRYHPASSPSPDPFKRFSDYLDKRLNMSNGSTYFHRDVFKKTKYPEDCRNSEDIPVSAHAVALFECTSVDKSLARVYKHPDSLRHNMVYADQVAMKIVDYVFDPQVIPDKFMSLRDSYKSQRCLSLFRSYYLAKDWAKAKKYYRLAVSTDRRSLLKWSYLSKFLRLMLRGRHE